ncbi:MAG: MBOAT family protein [bacterium]|nr:MBOAT family protein [bacterium]
MLFNSFIFLAFLAAVVPATAALRHPRARALFLLFASYAFYAYWDWRFITLLVLASVVDYAIGRKLGATQDAGIRRRLLLLSCLSNLGMLVFFKYFNFFAEGAQAAAASVGWHVESWQLRIALPLGISFYTFRTLSYIIDVYRRRLMPTDSLVDYALFVSFFPMLVAGPIERAGNLLPQFANLKSPSREQIREGMALIALGYFKKVLIGDAAGRVVDSVFGQPELYRSPELLAALLLFTIQIYADFAGYSNIARGIAKLVGVDLMKNFEQPYLSRSFSEFWRRWHISLSRWIWDYLFAPLISAVLRMISRLQLPTVEQEMRLAYPLAVITTMLLCGLWHGAGYTFLVWGGMHGLFLAFERLVVYRGRPIPMQRRIRGFTGRLRFVAGIITTQALVVLGWLFFRAESLDQARYILRQFVHWQGSELTGRFAFMVLVYALVILLLDLVEYRTKSETYLLRLRPAVAAGICTATMFVVCLYLATTKPLPFVYFQF